MKNAIWINEIFRLALEASPSGQLIVDNKGKICHINSKISDIFGYTAEELLHRNLEVLVPNEFRHAHPKYRDNFFDKPVVRAMGSGQVLFGQHKSGSKIPIEIGLNPLADNNKHYVLASIVDISERVKAERRFQLALEASPSGIILMNDLGNIILVNSKVEEIFGYYRDELINQSVGILVPDNYRQQHPKFITQFLRTPKSRSMGTGRDLFGLRKNGTEVPLEIGLNPLEIDGRVHVLASVVDISERKLAEQEKQFLNNQIQHAQRLESLGVLAGGTAHDFNNILAAISGNAELVLLNLPLNSPRRGKLVAYLDNIVRSCKRASDLTNQMLAYAGKGKMVVERTNINDLIEDISSLLSSTLPKKITLTTELHVNLPPLEADHSQIQQVILNLITNAAEAIGDKTGKISLATGIEFKKQDSLNSYKYFDYLEEGDYLYIEVIDNGCGMPKEVIENMFDPFFTTKFTGRGLGMAAVLGIIRSHFGSVKVTSSVNSGTRIKIIFPVSSKSSEHTQLEQESKKSHTKSALVIDDEQDVCEILADMLSINDFDVTSAATGEEGLGLIARATAPFDLIVLDMNMPGMSGAEVYDELMRMQCSSKILLVSGYSEQQVSSLIVSGNKSAIVHFLHKPFVYEKLKSVLDSLFQVTPN